MYYVGATTISSALFIHACFLREDDILPVSVKKHSFGEEDPWDN